MNKGLKFMFGLEIEMEYAECDLNPRGYNDTGANDIQEFGEYFFVEDDSSIETCDLDEGSEFISVPFSKSQAEEVVTDFCETIQK